MELGVELAGLEDVVEGAVVPALVGCEGLGPHDGLTGLGGLFAVSRRRQLLVPEEALQGLNLPALLEAVADAVDLFGGEANELHAGWDVDAATVDSPAAAAAWGGGGAVPAGAGSELRLLRQVRVAARLGLLLLLALHCEF